MLRSQPGGRETGTSATPPATAPEGVTGDGPAFNDAAHKINGLSCVQLNNLIVPGKRNTSSDQDEGFELESPGVPRRWCRPTAITTQGMKSPRRSTR